MSAVIYGPDGHPLVTSMSKDIAKVDRSTLETEVAKRVRNQATTLSSVWDKHRGKPKPTPVTYETLRMMANRNEWIRAIIKTRKNQIGSAEWAFQPVDEADAVGPAMKKVIERMTKLFKRPSMHGSRPHSRSWRQFIGEVLEDLLVLDAGVIEKERTRAGWIAAMYPVDGATIRPNIDNYGGFHEDAYVQMVEGQVTAKFGLEDLVFIMDNPLTDVRFAGYGFSPLEHLVISVTADLYSAKYNASYFEKGSVPEGLLNLGEDCAPEDLDAFRLYWMNEVMGKPWALPIVAGKGVEFNQWRENNRDMQFMEYQSWLLKKMCAVYQIAPQEIGELEDVNRSTANDQSEVNESKSVQPILTLLKDYFDVEIVGEHGQGLGDYLEFTWAEQGQSQEAIIAKYTSMIPIGAATRAEFREEMGMDQPDEDIVGAEGLDMYLADGQPQPLPSQEDTEVMGAKAQQDQAQQQQEQEGMQSQGPGSMPWKPANPNDPDFQGAKQDHNDAQGLGPSNEDEGGSPFGKTAGFTPHPLHGTEWHGKPNSPKSNGALRDHLTSLSAKHGGAWVATQTFGGGNLGHYPTRSSVPGHYQGSPHHHDGLAVNGKWQPWTSGQKKKESEVGMGHGGDGGSSGASAVGGKQWAKVRAMQAKKNVGKAHPDGRDRNPALTERQDALEDVWDDAHVKLVEGLAAILHVPVVEVEQVL